MLNTDILHSFLTISVKGIHVTQIRLWQRTIAVVAMGAIATGSAPGPTMDNGVQVAGRVVSFLQPAVSGTVTAAIVYQPGVAASESEARAIERALGSGLVVGSLRLKPKRVAADALDGLAGTKVAFVTQGADYRAITSASASRSILTISFDPACTKAALCAVAISSTPRVQIIVSKAATRAANLRFSSGFLMLVKEI